MFGDLEKGKAIVSKTWAEAEGVEWTRVPEKDGLALLRLIQKVCFVCSCLLVWCFAIVLSSFAFLFLT